MYTLGLFKVGRLPVPLPPLREQQEIAAEFERVTSLIEETQKNVEAESRRADRLRQSILKKAFEGKLVPQDPTDEPASILLERIKEAKGMRVTTAKERKKQKKPGRQLELL